MNVRESVTAMLASSGIEIHGGPAAVRVDRFDHWRNPEDAMVLPTRTGGEGGVGD